MPPSLRDPAFWIHRELIRLSAFISHPEEEVRPLNTRGATARIAARTILNLNSDRARNIYTELEHYRNNLKLFTDSASLTFTWPYLDTTNNLHGMLQLTKRQVRLNSTRHAFIQIRRRRGGRAALSCLCERVRNAGQFLLASDGGTGLIGPVAACSFACALSRCCCCSEAVHTRNLRFVDLPPYSYS